MPEVLEQPEVQTPTRSLTKMDFHRLLAPLAGLQYAVQGAGSMLLHGLDRATGDVDVIIQANELSEAMRRLKAAFPTGTTRPLGNERMRGFEMSIPDPLGGEPFEIDVAAPMQDGMDAEFTSDAIFARQGHAMSKPWTMFLKLRSNRDKDFDDLMMLHRSMNKEERLQTRDIIRKNNPDLMEDYKMIALMNKMPKAASWIHNNCKFAFSSLTMKVA